MSWSEGYSASLYASIVDPVTWRDIEKVDLTSVNIKRSIGGLRQSADLNCGDFYTNKDVWIRVWLDVRQSTGLYHTPLFTGTSVPTNRTIEGRKITYSMPCYSVLQPANDVYLPRGWYVPTESFGVEVVKHLLSVGPAPIKIEGESERLKQAIIAEESETNFSMAEKILAVLGWDLFIDGFGNITIKKPSDDAVSRYDSLNNDVIELRVSEEQNWYESPNVFRASMDDVSSVARDDDPNSMLSTVSRGREIWAEETNCELKENETISAYAIRRLKELQKHYTKLSYDVRYNPDINVGDVIDINYPEQQINGKYRITDQSIDIGDSIAVSEEAISL